MIGRDVKNKNYDKINLIEKERKREKKREKKRKSNEHNITYHGGRNRQPIWNRNKIVEAGR